MRASSIPNHGDPERGRTGTAPRWGPADEASRPDGFTGRYGCTGAVQGWGGVRTGRVTFTHQHG